MTRGRSARRGNYAIEFALILPVLIAILTGIVDYGWFFNQRMAVTLVARDAARAGSLAELGTDVAAIGMAQGTASMEAARLGGQVTCTLQGFSPDQRVRCEARAPFSPLIGLGPVPTSMRSVVTMRMEEQP